jgi:hypothetical protein
VRFYFRDDSGERLLAQTTLDNDGAGPSGQNVAVAELADGTWQVTLMAAQQVGERWIVELGSGDARVWKPERNMDADGAQP